MFTTALLLYQALFGVALVKATLSGWIVAVYVEHVEIILLQVEIDYYRSVLLRRNDTVWSMLDYVRVSLHDAAR